MEDVDKYINSTSLLVYTTTENVDVIKSRRCIREMFESNVEKVMHIKYCPEKFNSILYY